MTIKCDRWTLEAAARVTFCACCAYSLAIFALRIVVPESFGYLIGSLSSIYLITKPKLLFGISGSVASHMFAFLYATGVASYILCGATISDGLFLTLYIIHSMIITTLFFGDCPQSAFAPCLVGLSGMFALSLSSTVKDGLAITYPLSSAIPDLFSDFCQPNDQALADCDLPAQYQVPDNADVPFAGQTVSLTAENDELIVQIPGGLWVVASYWTESGLTNNLAQFRNFLLAFGWVCVFLCGMILLPPIRTMRDLLSKLLIPKLLEQIQCEWEESGENSDTEPSTEQVAAGVKRFKLLEVAQPKVGMIVHEPRLCALFVYNVPELTQLLMDTKSLVLANISPIKSHPKTKEEAETRQTMMNESTTLIKATIQALRTRNKSDLQLLEELAGRIEESCAVDTAKFSREAHLCARCKKVADSAIAWLHSLETRSRSLTFTEKMANAKKMYLPWITLPLAPWIQATKNVQFLSFHPKKWELTPFLWSLKFTAGYAALFAMFVYWDAYATFRIKTTNVVIGAVYSGWHLMAYSGSWLPTAEGTFKKGFQRAFGTCLGGFASWLGVIIASGSYDAEAEVNPYGIIAWLTVMEFLGFFLGTERGLKAFLGPSHDHGYAGGYFTMVTALISLEVYYGKGSRNDLVANRVTANLTGIVMAMILAFIPPVRKGRDPNHVLAYCLALKKAFTTLLESVEEQGDEPLDLKDFEGAFAEAVKAGSKANYLLSDAQRVQMLPFLKVDPRLSSSLSDLLQTASLIKRAGEILGPLSVEKNEDILALCDELRKSKTLKQVGEAEDPREVDTEDPSYSAHLFSWIQIINRRLEKAEATLEELKQNRHSSKKE